MTPFLPQKGGGSLVEDLRDRKGGNRGSLTAGDELGTSTYRASFRGGGEGHLLAESPKEGEDGLIRSFDERLFWVVVHLAMEENRWYSFHGREESRRSRRSVRVLLRSYRQEKKRFIFRSQSQKKRQSPRPSETFLSIPARKGPMTWDTSKRGACSPAGADAETEGRLLRGKRSNLALYATRRKEPLAALSSISGSPRTASVTEKEGSQTFEGGKLSVEVGGAV